MMNLIENIFQITASVLFKIGHHLKIDTIIQYRIILSTVAITQSVMVYAGLQFLLNGKAYYEIYDDIIALYAFIYVAIITILTAISWRYVFKKRDTILPWHNTHDTSEHTILQTLTKTRESYSFGLFCTFICGLVFWNLLSNNPKLIILFIIPLLFEVSANILATCWEISLLTNKLQIKTTQKQ